MTNATDLVDEALCHQIYPDLPAPVIALLERHRQTLLNLAMALIGAGRDEREVVAILHSASESFSAKLNSEIERMQL